MSSREARLAEALRQNLKRRKAAARQRRDRDGQDPQPSADPEGDVATDPQALPLRDPAAG
ncbi:hypothetical protein [Pannonibacter tanglangensis]|uniref:DUF4169 domain-containing protein n=1 Tax=Pannonibacter tanglangensis TaxID=2750084 RepID=A0ABW9ZE13_9HYPH|nr:hypothetical protein [Pannonibacter sp. XCT-34]NBN63083.1 hypothetical protein [Pannonibacter sp. XCT-34]